MYDDKNVFSKIGHKTHFKCYRFMFPGKEVFLPIASELVSLMILA